MLCRNAGTYHKGEPSIIHWEQDRKAEGRERGWCSWEGAATPSPPARSVGSAVSSPAAPIAQRIFPLFSVLRMASPDTIILLSNGYHAAIEGGKAPVPPPLASAPDISFFTPARMALILDLSAINVAKFQWRTLIEGVKYRSGMST